MEVCPASKSLSGSDRRVTLRFEDYKEENVADANCEDPRIVLTATPD